MDLEIRGRKALLSGASRGMGKACAMALAREGVDVTIVRIILAVLTVVGVGVGVPLYLAGWLLIPEEGAPQSIASDLIQSLSSRTR